MLICNTVKTSIPYPKKAYIPPNQKRVRPKNSFYPNGPDYNCPDCFAKILRQNLVWIINKMKTLLLTFLYCCYGTYCYAQWSAKPQAGVGFTDNANYDSSEKKSDFYLWLGGFGQNQTSTANWNYYLNFKDYLRENQNDRTTYRVGRLIEVDYQWSGKMDWLLALGGLQYNSGSPALNEESFNNIYIESSFTKTFSKGDSLEFRLEPGARLRLYSDFDGRFDQMLYLNASSDWAIAPERSFHPFAEFGLTFSNKSEYSHSYLELGADYSWEPNLEWQYLFGLLIRHTSYFSRSVSVITAVTDRRGRVATNTETANEGLSLFQLHATIIKQHLKNQIKSSLIVAEQTSRSGYAGYKETQLQVTYIIPFP
jgi:hypothetical protein